MIGRYQLFLDFWKHDKKLTDQRAQRGDRGQWPTEVRTIEDKKKYISDKLEKLNHQRQRLLKNENTEVDQKNKTEQQLIDLCETILAKKNTPKGIVPVAGQPQPSSSPTESQGSVAEMKSLITDDSQSEVALQS